MQLLSRTVRRTPEVMVKVLTKGGRDLRAVGRHLRYLSRDGEVEIETDDGRRLSGQGVERDLLENWDLDIEEDGMYRAMQRDASRRIQEYLLAPGKERKTVSEASSRQSLLHTRAQVGRGWMAVAEILDRQGQPDLAWYVRRFTETLPPIRTDRELLRQALKPRERGLPQQELAP